MQAPRRKHAVGIAVAGLAVAAIAAMAFVPMIASAQEVDWSITAREQDDCSEGTYCFELSQDSFEAGTEVNATFTNPEANQADHDALVELDGDWDSNHEDTDPAEADASAGGADENFSPGNGSSFTFTVPSDRNDFYLWCDVTGHEGLGMWAVIDVTGVGSGGDGNGDGDGTDGGPSTPGFSALAGLAAAGVAALVVRRRR